MNERSKCWAVLAVFLWTALPNLSARAAGEEVEVTSYSLQFEITGDFAARFSVVASDDYQIMVDANSADQRLGLEATGEVKSLPDDKVKLQFKFDIDAEKGDSKLRVVTQGGVVTKLGHAVTLFSSGDTELKVTLQKQE